MQAVPWPGTILQRVERGERAVQTSTLGMKQIGMVLLGTESWECDKTVFLEEKSTVSISRGRNMQSLDSIQSNNHLQIKIK